MPGPEFFQTTMGQRFYEGTVPKLTGTLERVADALEKVVKATDDAADYLCDDNDARAQLLHSAKQQIPPEDYAYYTSAARREFAEDGVLEIDDEPLISSGFGDGTDGVYVQAWVWVDKPVGEQDAGDE